MATLIQLLSIEQKSWLPLAPGKVGVLERSALSNKPVLNLKLPRLGNVRSILVNSKLHSL